MFLFCLVFAMSLCASVYMCFVVTCWERADLLALVCGVFCEFVTFPLVSWVRCGTWLYRFLIFAPLLTSIRSYSSPKLTVTLMSNCFAKSSISIRVCFPFGYARIHAETTLVFTTVCRVVTGYFTRHRAVVARIRVTAWTDTARIHMIIVIVIPLIRVAS